MCVCVCYPSVCVCVWQFMVYRFACYAGIALLFSEKFYVLACFTFQLASFVRTEKLFNMRRTKCEALRGRGGKGGG